MDFSELSIDGRISTPEDADWNETRQAWNLAADPHPQAVAFVESAADVAAVVGFARDHDLKVLGQGTGHGAVAVGSFEGTIVIKTERLRGVEVDPERRIARVERRGPRDGPEQRRAGARALLPARLLAERRSRRLHPRRRPELARAPSRLRLQPGSGARAGDRGRRAADRRRRQRPGAVLGPARRRRRLRDRHRAAPRADRDDRGLRRGAAVPGRARSRRRAPYRDWAAELPDEVDLGRPLPAPAADPGRAGAASRQAAADDRRGASIGDQATGERLFAPMRELGEPIMDTFGQMPGRRSEPDPHGPRAAGPRPRRRCADPRAPRRGDRGVLRGGRAGVRLAAGLGRAAPARRCVRAARRRRRGALAPRRRVRHVRGRRGHETRGSTRRSASGSA